MTVIDIIGWAIAIAAGVAFAIVALALVIDLVLVFVVDPLRAWSARDRKAAREREKAAWDDVARTFRTVEPSGESRRKARPR